MTFLPTQVDALQWALDADQGSGEPYEPEPVDGRAVLRALNDSGTIRANRGQACYEFDGVAAYVGGMAAFPVTAGMSVSFWINVDFTAAGAGSRAIVENLVDSNNDFGVIVNNVSMFTRFQIGGVETISDFNGMGAFDNLWIFVTVVQASPNNLIYVDAVSRSVGTSASLGTTTAGFEIGSRSGGNFLQGLLRDVRIFSQTLTQEEIDYLFTDGKTGTDPGLPLGGYYGTEENEGQAIDFTGQNHGLITNAVLLDFHAVDSGVLVNEANRSGYTLGVGDVIIPADQSDLALDALLGQPLDFTGLAPNLIATTTPMGTIDKGTDPQGQLTLEDWGPDFDMSRSFEVAVTVLGHVIGNSEGILGTRDASAPWWQIMYNTNAIELAVHDGADSETLRFPVIANEFHTARVNFDHPTSTWTMHVDGNLIGSFVTSPGVSVAPILRCFRGIETGNMSISNVKLSLAGTDVADYSFSEGYGTRVWNTILSADRHGLLLSTNVANYWELTTNESRDHGIEYGGRNAATFDGQDDTAVGPEEMIFSGPFTWSMWIRPTIANARVILGDSSGGGSPNDSFGRFNATALTFRRDNFDTSFPLATIEVPLDERYLLTVTRGADDVVRAYKNEVADSNTLVIPGPFQVGRRISGRSSNVISLFWGTIDNLRLFNRELSAAEVLQLSDFSYSGTDDVRHYKMDDNSGTLLVDSSVNGADADLIDTDATFWQFTPGLIDGSAAADGGQITLLPGHFCNAASTIDYDPWTAPELVDLLLPAESPVGQLQRNDDPTERKYRSENAPRFVGSGDFDGLDNQVDFPDAFFSGEYTVCLWMRPKDFAQRTVVGNNASERIHFTGFSNLITPYAGSMNTIDLNFQDDELVHFAVTRDAANVVRCYKNGIAAASQPVSTGEDFMFRRLGAYNVTTFRWFGLMSDVRFYDVAKTGEELNAIAAGDPDPTGLKRQYIRDPGSGLTVPDTSGNSQDGTLTDADPALWWGSLYLDGQPFADGDNHIFTTPAAITGEALSDAIKYIGRYSSAATSFLVHAF